MRRLGAVVVCSLLVAAYVIVGIDWHDPESLDRYRRDIVRVVESYGGRFLASAADVDVREGDWHPKRVVVIEFGSPEDARAWYESEEYRPLLELRRRGASTDLVLLHGLD